MITLLFGAACAAGGHDKDAPIESQQLDVGLEGNFQNSWSGNGISVQEVGSSQSDGKELAQIIQGEYQYTAPGGEVVSARYIADKDGVRVEGTHLPVAPEPLPIPSYIVKALEWAAAHPYNEEAELKKTYN